MTSYKPFTVVRLPHLAAAAAAAALLAGCATGQVVPVSSSGSAPPSPTPEAEVEVATVDIGSDALFIRAKDKDDSVLAEFDYFADPADIRAALTDAFGSEPEEVPYPGTLHEAPGTDYTWGGFVLRVLESEPNPPAWSNISYIATEPAVGDVVIRAGWSTAIAVGDTVNGIEPCPGWEGSPEFEDQNGVPSAWHCVDSTSLGDVEGTGTDWIVSAGAKVTVEYGAVVQLFGQLRSYGP